MDGDSLAAAISGAQRGEAAQFDRLVQHFAGRLFGFLYRMTGSRSESEDLMQEVFVRMVRMIGVYQHQGRFEAWLFRIAANLCRDRIRRARRTPHRVILQDGTDESDSDGLDRLTPAAKTQAPDAGLIRQEETDALGRALAAIPEAERTVVMLRHFSGMSFKEIADSMGTPLGTALARAHRGLIRLREIMGSEGDAASANSTQEDVV